MQYFAVISRRRWRDRLVPSVPKGKIHISLYPEDSGATYLRRDAASVAYSEAGMLMSLRSSVSLAICFALGFAAFGCTSPSDEESTDQSQDELRWPFGDGSGGFGIGGGAAQGQVVAGPNGIYTTIVKANGSGCPKGSWTAGISPDGTTFTV